MKRKVVQHGPSTLTVSIPARWAKRHGLRKGDELTVSETGTLLQLSAAPRRSSCTKRVDTHAMHAALIHKTLSALYKAGCDRAVVGYANPRDLELIHTLLDRRFIGFEIVEETSATLTIARISEPHEEDVHVLFRRLFHFLLSIADEGLIAAKAHDADAYRKLTLRDVHVDKMANYCTSVVHRQGQSRYPSDLALYHLLEQLEKIGDAYKELNKQLRRSEQLPERVLCLYAEANALLRQFAALFFSFSLERADLFARSCDAFRQHAEALEEMGACAGSVHLLRMIVRELYNLISTTIILNI